MGEAFRELRELQREKRRDNTENSTRLLEQRGIPFVSKNDGAHLIVDGRVDFWPSTGKWKPRNAANYRRGVYPLLGWLANHPK